MRRSMIASLAATLVAFGLLEQAWVEYLLSFPAGGSGLPTVLDDAVGHPQYRPSPSQRITFAT